MSTQVDAAPAQPAVTKRRFDDAIIEGFDVSPEMAAEISSWMRARKFCFLDDDVCFLPALSSTEDRTERKVRAHLYLKEYIYDEKYARILADNVKDVVRGFRFACFADDERYTLQILR